LVKGCSGNIILRLTKGGEPEPIFNAGVIIGEGEKEQTLLTDTDGRVDFTYYAPQATLSLNPLSEKRPYSICDIRISASGINDIRIIGCQVFDDVSTILNCEVTTHREGTPVKKQTTRIPVHRLWALNPKNNDSGIFWGDISTNSKSYFKIIDMSRKSHLEELPEYIVVHCGKANEEAINKTVSFSEYIKNVASGVLYPTWPEAALQANILALISLAKNRLYTNYYRSLGYGFDIAAEQDGFLRFCEGRMHFEPICRIVGELLNCYIVKNGYKEPLCTKLCDGVRVPLGGLSQWGSVTMAQKGNSRDEILMQYYGDNIQIKMSEPTHKEIFLESLQKGCISSKVKMIQRILNRVALFYPTIPFIRDAEGSFGSLTEAAVKAYQRFFKLPMNGIIDRLTWDSIVYVNNSINKYAEFTGRQKVIYDDKVLIYGDMGNEVVKLQHSINSLSRKLGEKCIPKVNINGRFDDRTRNSVTFYQKYKKIPLSGVADKNTRKFINDECCDFIATGGCTTSEKKKYPGYPVVRGSEGEDVIYIQNAINAIKTLITGKPELVIDGVFGEKTYKALIDIQTIFGLNPDGVVEDNTWVMLECECPQTGTSAVG